LLFSIFGTQVFAHHVFNHRYWGGGRTSGTWCGYYNSSITTYGYGPHFDAALAQWNGINAKVSVSKCAFDSSTANEFHVVTSGSGSYGLHTPMGWDPVVGQWYETDPDSAPWNWSAVYIYHDKMEDDSLTYSERVKTITHEIGHALSLKHPQVENSTAFVTGAVMTSGKATTTVTSFDETSLNNRAACTNCVTNW